MLAGQLLYENQRKHGGAPECSIGDGTRSANSDHLSRRHPGPGDFVKPRETPVLVARSSRLTEPTINGSVRPSAKACCRTSW